jgi:type IX secretion system PorP/SprF family membrane protein
MKGLISYLFLNTAGIAILMLLASFPINCLAQQKVQFTQYMFNEVVINPAYAGADEALSLTFIQRKQWANIESSPSTQTLSAHTLFKKKHFGLGATIINDRIGVHRNLSAMSNFAYHLRVGKESYLSMGLQAGIHSRKSDYARLASAANMDPKLFDAAISYTAFDLGMGFYYRSPRLHMGLSAPELLPEEFNLNDTTSITLRDANYFLFTRYTITLNENIDLEPSVLLKYFAGIPLSYDVNMSFIFRKVLTLGLSYRKKESVDFMLRGQLTPQMQFGYSYDHPIGEVSKVSNGSHELMINYVFKYVKSKVDSPR